MIGSNDHGLADNRRMIDALKTAGADADIHVVQGAGHGFQTPATAWPDAESAMFTFLAKEKIVGE